MEIEAFLGRLERLTVPQLRELAVTVGPPHQTAADEVEEWRVVLVVEQALRRNRRGREAAQAAYLASHAVQAAARRAGVPLPDDGITRVARAAAQVARAVVAGEGAETALQILLHGWTSHVQPAA